MADYVVKAGAKPGPLDMALSYSDGTTPTITGATITFYLRPYGGGATVLSEAGSVLNATTARYTPSVAWQTAITTPGLYEAEVRVVYLDGREERFPADEDHPYVTIYVEAAIPAV